MKKLTKILSTSLFGISALATTAVVATSCGKSSDSFKITTVTPNNSWTSEDPHEVGTTWKPIEVLPEGEYTSKLVFNTEAMKTAYENAKIDSSSETVFTYSESTFTFTKESGMAEFGVADYIVKFKIEVYDASAKIKKGESEELSFKLKSC